MYAHVTVSMSVYRCIYYVSEHVYLLLQSESVCASMGVYVCVQLCACIKCKYVLPLCAYVFVGTNIYMCIYKACTCFYLYMHVRTIYVSVCMCAFMSVFMSVCLHLVDKFHWL